MKKQTWQYIAYAVFTLSLILTGGVTLLYSPVPFQDIKTWKQSGAIEAFAVIFPVFLLYVAACARAFYKGRFFLAIGISLFVGLIALYPLWIIYLAASIS